MLDGADDSDRVERGPAKTYQVKMVKGKSYMIDLESTAFGTFLRVENSAGIQLARNGSRSTNARIVFEAPADGTYRVIAAAVWGTGPFSLKLREK